MQKHSTTEISAKFQALRSRNEGALITYLTGGDPNPKDFYENMTALLEAGTDIVEVGIPFSDPIADGPVIQASSQRALAAGATPRKVLRMLGELSQSYPDAPVVLLTYFNPVLAMGLDRFMRDANRSGVSGVVVPDLPVEESADYQKAARKHGVDTVFLTAPNTSRPRLERIVQHTTGFLYLVSLYGVTGPRETLSESVLTSVKRVKDVSKSVPTAAGFGIARPEHVSMLMQSGADGAIVGSALVKLVTENLGNPEGTQDFLKEKVSRLKRATLRNDNA